MLWHHPDWVATSWVTYTRCFPGWGCLDQPLLLNVLLCNFFFLVRVPPVGGSCITWGCYRGVVRPHMAVSSSFLQPGPGHGWVMGRTGPLLFWSISQGLSWYESLTHGSSALGALGTACQPMLGPRRVWLDAGVLALLPGCSCASTCSPGLNVLLSWASCVWCHHLT